MSTSLPAHRPAVVPYLLVDRARDLIPFIESVFDADVLGSMDRPDGSLGHAEIRIGDAMVMIGEPMGELASMPGMVYVTVDDCDAAYRRALDAGATSLMEVTHMHHAGERYGGVTDLAGNVWWIATHVEDVSWEEQARRVDALTDQNRDDG